MMKNGKKECTSNMQEEGGVSNAQTNIKNTKQLDEESDILEIAILYLKYSIEVYFEALRYFLEITVQ